MLNKTLILVTLMALTQACGQDEGAGSAAKDKLDDSKTEPTTAATGVKALAIAKYADLPECNEDNETQLVYVRENKTFYSCESSNWEVVEISDGKDGKDGANGITTVKEVEATNKKNIWNDPISGKTWVIGSGTWQQAVDGCTAGYTIPTWAEAIVAINHGIMAIANDSAIQENFWVKGALSTNPNQWYAFVSSGTPTAGDYLATSSRGIYCISE